MLACSRLIELYKSDLQIYSKDLLAILGNVAVKFWTRIKYLSFSPSPERLVRGIILVMFVILAFEFDYNQKVEVSLQTQDLNNYYLIEQNFYYLDDDFTQRCLTVVIPW